MPFWDMTAVHFENYVKHNYTMWEKCKLFKLKWVVCIVTTWISGFNMFGVLQPSCINKMKDHVQKDNIRLLV
jgi:hypothetical protein